MNGHNVTFTLSDDTPDCYMALFPNFAERDPAPRPNSKPINALDPSKKPGLANPSGRVMPGQYFMFMETLPVDDSGQLYQDIFNVAIGFR